MLKWLGGIVATVASALIIWLITKPPAPKPASSFGGSWTYTMKSDKSHKTYNGSLLLVMDGTNVSGKFMDNFFDKSSTGILGALYSGNDFEFAREIENKNTTQHFSLAKKSDNMFAGKFWNDGPLENADGGTFEMKRGP